MNPVKDLKDRCFGRLVVDAFAGTRKHPHSKRSLAYWSCKCECGNTKAVSGRALVRGSTKSCGCLRKENNKGVFGDSHPSWQGGKRYCSGYVRLYRPDHPSADKGGYVTEHRLVMEEFLNRQLYRGETVHHKNGIRDDNRLENLELWSSNHPSGQRVQDLVAWAMEVIDRYMGVATDLAKQDCVTT